MASVSVLCAGEILLDCYGTVRQPGGAPANLACHAAALGADAELISRIGRDAAGSHLAEWLRQRRVTAHLQTDSTHPTGSVDIVAGPRYEIASPAAWDFIGPSEGDMARAAAADVFYFGSLAQRHPVSRWTIRVLVSAARRARVPALCDLNLRAPFFDGEAVLWCLRNCDTLKLNREEVVFVSDLLGAKGKTEDLFGGLLREFSIPGGVLTCGEEGALLYEKGDLFHQPAEMIPVVADEVGAGDAFGAVTAVALARGLPLRQAAAPAAALAAYVVSQRGATPEIPRDLVARINGMLAG